MALESHVVGIDVGGLKRGFEACPMSESGQIKGIVHDRSPEALINQIDELVSNIKVIAIDSPPKSWIRSDKTRLAERELHKAGYRVQWTPRDQSKTSEWMSNGEKLWTLLEKRYPKAKLIETFPTVACCNLSHDATPIPLHFFCGKSKREYYKDMIDAVICASVARKYLTNPKQLKIYGKSDPHGEIYA